MVGEKICGIESICVGTNGSSNSNIHNNSCLVIELSELMEKKAKRFDRLCNEFNDYPGATKTAFRIADRWNRIRKAVEYQTKGEI